jgi:hypothetical protein
LTIVHALKQKVKKKMNRGAIITTALIDRLKYPELYRVQRNGVEYVYLVYADDSGRDNKWKIICAVIFSGSAYDTTEFILGSCIESYVPEAMRCSFEFHASDIWNRKSPEFAQLQPNDTEEIFTQCALAIDGLELSIVYGAVDIAKLKSGPGLYSSASPIDIAFRVCAIKVEEWFAEQAANDFGLLICDDGDKRHKDAMQQAFRALRPRIRSSAMDRGRLSHLHDDMYFGDSRYSAGIQIADFAGFLIMHHLDGRQETAKFYDMIKDRISAFGVEPA